MGIKRIKSKGVFCPSCGKSRGVELLEETHIDNTRSYYIRCNNEGTIYKISNYGEHQTRKTQPMRELERSAKNVKCPNCKGELKTVAGKPYLKCKKCGHHYWMPLR